MDCASSNAPEQRCGPGAVSVGGKRVANHHHHHHYDDDNEKMVKMMNIFMRMAVMALSMGGKGVTINDDLEDYEDHDEHGNEEEGGQ